jgi:hypothetical protein
MTLTTTEEEILVCFKALKVRPGRLVPVKTLWLQWHQTAPGGHNTDFGDALKHLTRRGFVDSPDGDKSVTVSLTDAGHAAIRLRHATSNITIFNIGNIGSATGLGVFGDHATIGSPSLPNGDGFDAMARRPLNREQPSDNLDKTVQLTFLNTTEVDVESMRPIWASSGDADIAYHDEIRNATSSLERQHRFGADFVAQHSNFRETDKHTLGEDVKAHVRRVRSKLNDRIDMNKKALNALLERIRKASIPEALAIKSLSTFGSFAALRLIFILKEGYDIVEGKQRFWFTEWNFNREHSPCVFDAVPHHSKSGLNAFGDLYFVLARVGAEVTYSNPGADYFRVTMPFEVGRRLLLSFSKGDQEAYFVWVLPQLLLAGHEEAAMKDFPVNAWVIDRLTGANGVEWHGGSQNCPWELNQNMINYHR